jgi:hypothetical protein
MSPLSHATSATHGVISALAPLVREVKDLISAPAFWVALLAVIAYRLLKRVVRPEILLAVAAAIAVGAWYKHYWSWSWSWLAPTVLGAALGSLGGRSERPIYPVDESEWAVAESALSGAPAGERQAAVERALKKHREARARASSATSSTSSAWANEGSRSTGGESGPGDRWAADRAAERTAAWNAGERGGPFT